MKNTIKNISIIAVCALALAACNKDTLSDESVIVTSTSEENDFDRWLDHNYRSTYNINFVYRYDETEMDYNYYTVPADYEASVKMAHILKHVCLEAYDDVAGVDFTRAYFPKMVVCSGEWLYKNNGTFVGASATGGRKINLEGLNHLIAYMNTSMTLLNTYYLHTVHHEFTHILNQTKNYPTSYQTITGTYYVGGVWGESPYDLEKYYLSHGFVSAYSQQEVGEDFAEVLSTYVTTTTESWNAMLDRASADTDTYNETNGTSLPDGAEVIKSKLDVIRTYMLESWDIDLDELHDIVQRRVNEIFSGAYDLDDLSIK